jgi:hypothetical protein
MKRANLELLPGGDVRWIGNMIANLVERVNQERGFLGETLPEVCNLGRLPNLREGMLVGEY